MLTPTTSSFKTLGREQVSCKTLGRAFKLQLGQAWSIPHRQSDRVKKVGVHEKGRATEPFQQTLPLLDRVREIFGY